MSDEFGSLLEEEEVGGSPIMVFANKQDVEGCMAPEEISEILKPSEIKERSWAIYKTSAVTGDCLLYTSPSPRDRQKSRMPSSA